MWLNTLADVYCILRLNVASNEPSRSHWVEYESDDDTDEEHLSPKQLGKSSLISISQWYVIIKNDHDNRTLLFVTERRREFKKKRAQHYNEYYKVKLARELIAKVIQSS